MLDSLKLEKVALIISCFRRHVKVTRKKANMCIMKCSKVTLNILFYFRLPSKAFQTVFEQYPESLVRIVQVRKSCCCSKL